MTGRAESDARMYHSGPTGRTYATYEDMVRSEGLGWVVVGVFVGEGKNPPWTAATGLYSTQREARNAAVRLRTRWKRELREESRRESDLLVVRVRPLWREVR